MKSEKAVRKPNQTRSRETKERIIKAANDLFAEQGYYKTNTKLIAQRAGVPVGSIYAYFADKKAVLLESIRIGYEKIEHNMSGQGIDFTDELNEAVAVPPEDFIRAIINSNIEIHKQLPIFHRDMKFLRTSEPEIKDYLKFTEKRSFEQTKKMLQQVPNLKVTDLDAAAVVVHRIIENFTHYLTYEDPMVSKERIIKQITLLLTAYIAG